MVDRVRLLERRDIDELIILDIAATPNNRGPRFDEVAELCSNLFCPVTIGGGVRTCDDIARLLRCGADKVSINTAALERPEFISEASRRFGAQAIVASLDVRREGLHGGDASPGRYYSGSTPRHDAENRAGIFEGAGAGELLLCSVDRDGTMVGYDLDLIRMVCDKVSIPVIACGGCGSYEHMEQAFNAGAHAVAAGAFFQFREATPKGAARYLHDHGLQVRL